MSEEDIDSRLPYRIGCPKLPALPVEMKIRPNPNIEAYIPNFKHHKRNIVDVLANHGILGPAINFAYRVNYGAVATDEDLTLVIVSTYWDGCRDNWIKAVKEIRAGLVQHDIYWRIELVADTVFYGPMLTSPISSTDCDLIKGWSKVLPDLLNLIKDQDWIAVDVLYRDFPSRERQPTAVISARDANDDSWNITLSTLNQLLQAHNVEVDVVLLYLKDLRMMTDNPTSFPDSDADPLVVQSSSPNYLISASFYQDTLQMGTSCATSGSKSSGTLGGRVKLQGDGSSSVLDLGLTNYHVMKDAFQDQGLKSGPFPPASALEQPYRTVVSPSDRDHTSTETALGEELSSAEKHYEKLAQKLECWTDDDPKSEQLRGMMNTAFYKYKMLESRLQTANKLSRLIGSVYAASGFRTCENPKYRAEMASKDWALDWCLVQINQPNLISNQLEEVSSIDHHILKDATVTHYCSIDAHKNYEVIKRGRTTGWTRGTISAIPSVVHQGKPTHIKPTTPTYQKVQFEEKWEGKFVFVHPIIGTKEVPLYIDHGDSGSFVLLDEANNSTAPVVGLGFAGNNATLSSYMMPIDLVVKDIEEVTGLKVIEPEYLGEA